MTKKNLPEAVGAEDSAPTDQPTVHIENFNHRTNDLDALRRLAEVSPDLAQAYLDNSDRSDSREYRSTNIAVIVTGLLAAFTLLGAGLILVNLGVIQTTIFIAVMLGISHLLRVILTGKWSSTSWIGQLISGKNDRNSSDDG